MFLKWTFYIEAKKEDKILFVNYAEREKSESRVNNGQYERLDQFQLFYTNVVVLKIRIDLNLCSYPTKYLGRKNYWKVI